MKVLHVVPSIGLLHGGVSVSVRELCLGLAESGIETALWTTPRAHDPAVDGPGDALLKKAGVDLRYFPVHPWKWLGTGWSYSPALRDALAEQLSRFDLVHIHAIWLYTTFAAARACRRAHVPYALTLYGALDPYGLRVRRARKLLYGRLVERAALQGAAAIHFTSDREKQVAFMFGVRRPSAVVPHALKLEAIPATPDGLFRRTRPETGTRQILLFLGRLHPKKRLDIVAEIFKRIARRRDDIHLVIAGPDEGSSADVRRILGPAGLLEKTSFTGMLDGDMKWAALRESALFLLPSEDENFGVAVLEAMATGLPVLVSNEVALADAIRRSGAGLVLPVDASAWEEPVESLLRDAPRRKAMGAAGRTLVEQEFACRKMASSMRDFYESALRGHLHG